MLKFFRRLGIFKNSTGSLKYDPATREGFSYRWFQLSRVIGGYVFLNAYRYSNTTAKHIHALANLPEFSRLNPVEVYCPKGLQEPENGIEYMKRQAEFFKGKAERARKENYKFYYTQREIELRRGACDLQLALENRARGIDDLRNKKEIESFDEGKTI